MAGLNIGDEHRPLMGGISIVRQDGGNSRGSLCLIARRKSDHKKVLTTAAHVFGSLNVGYRMCQGGDEYNDRVARLYRETLDDGTRRESWRYHESTPGQDAKFGDFAAALLLTNSNGELSPVKGLDGQFGVHKHEEGSATSHQELPVVKGAYDPVMDETYYLYGAKSGITQVTVSQVDRTREVKDGLRMRGLTLLDERQSSPRPTSGDSGAPIVVEDTDGNLRIAALYFGGDPDEPVGYAYPASVVERELGIYFGVQIPTAVASGPQAVRPSQKFSLKGLGSAAKEPGATISEYKWEQQHITAIPGKGTDTHTPTFTAPNGETTLTFKLTVTDSNGAKATTTVNVSVDSRVPKADAGPPQEVNVGSSVQLDGSKSVAKVTASSQAGASASSLSVGPSIGGPGIGGPGTGMPVVGGPVKGGPGKGMPVVGSPGEIVGDQLDYKWKQTEGTTVNLSDTTVAKPTFTAPNQVGTLKFQLTVTNSHKLSDSAEVEITVIDPSTAPPKPTSGQWDVRHSNGKIQFKVTSLPTVTPAVSQARALLEAGQPPNLTTLTKPIGITLNAWVTALSSGDAKWRTGSWAAHIRFENSAGNSPYSASKSVTVPTPTPPPTPKPPPVTPPPVTHSYRDITPAVYSGCGPNRTRKQECVRLGHEDTNWRNASEPYVWDNWKDDGQLVTSYGPWSNVGSPQPISGVCKQKKKRTVTETQRQSRQNHCGGREFRNVTGTRIEFGYDTVSETWGSWRDTGNMRENQILLIMEKEQERFSSPCNRRQTRWVYHSDVG